MNRRAYALVVATVTATSFSLGLGTPLAAHTGQQAFDTLEMITGEKPDLSVPVAALATTPTAPSSEAGSVYAVLLQDSLAK